MNKEGRGLAFNSTLQNSVRNRNFSETHHYHGPERSMSDNILLLFNFFFILPLLVVTYRRAAHLGSFSPPGFANAPITKGIVYLTAVFSIISSFQNGTPEPHALHWWKSSPKFIFSLATYQLYFTSVWQTICGCILIYHFRLFERQWGVRKYGTFCISMLLVSGALGLALLVLGRDGIVNEIACGPYGHLFATLVQVIQNAIADLSACLLLAFSPLLVHPPSKSLLTAPRTSSIATCLRSTTSASSV